MSQEADSTAAATSNIVEQLRRAREQAMARRAELVAELESLDAELGFAKQVRPAPIVWTPPPPSNGAAHVVTSAEASPLDDTSHTAFVYALVARMGRPVSATEIIDEAIRLAPHKYEQGKTTSIAIHGALRNLGKGKGRRLIMTGKPKSYRYSVPKGGADGA
jgi:hypothetical protein